MNLSLADQLGKQIYGMTKDDAIEKGVCIQCKEKAKPRIYSQAGEDEYFISGLCEQCFDSITRC